MSVQAPTLDHSRLKHSLHFTLSHRNLDELLLERSSQDGQSRPKDVDRAAPSFPSVAPLVPGHWGLHTAEIHKQRAPAAARSTTAADGDHRHAKGPTSDRATPVRTRYSLPYSGSLITYTCPSRSSGAPENVFLSGAHQALLPLDDPLNRDNRPLKAAVQ